MLRFCSLKSNCLCSAGLFICSWWIGVFSACGVVYVTVVRLILNTLIGSSEMTKHRWQSFAEFFYKTVILKSSLASSMISPFSTSSHLFWFRPSQLHGASCYSNQDPTYLLLTWNLHWSGEIVRLLVRFSGYLQNRFFIEFSPVGDILMSKLEGDFINRIESFWRGR